MRTSHTIFISFLNFFLHLHVKNCPRPTDSEKTISSVIVGQGEIYSEDFRESPENLKITKLIISQDGQTPLRSDTNRCSGKEPAHIVRSILSRKNEERTRESVGNRACQ